jgi:hypothetical protein
MDSLVYPDGKRIGKLSMTDTGQVMTLSAGEQ